MTGTVADVRDDLTDRTVVRRRASTWRWVVSVGFAAGLLIVLAVLVATVLGTGDDRSADRPALIVLGAAAGACALRRGGQLVRGRAA